MSKPQQQSHQDWEPVVFNKKPAAAAAAKSLNVPATTSSSLASVGIYAAASDDDVKKTKYVSKNTSLAISLARREKKMTQKELAQKCNFEVSIISDVERGTCVYNATHVNKIQSVLGVKIPRV
jgi:ribosome-binding protein aMBF1 (putative translation factor)